MRTFAYHHWDEELVFVGDWSAGGTAAEADPAAGAVLPAEIGQPAFTHCAAIELLGTLGEPADGDLLAQHLLLASAPSSEPLRVAVLQALYGLSWHTGQPPAGSQLVAVVIALARDGTGESRRRAVQLLGRFPRAVTGLLLHELAHDPTNTVCCLAERALAEQGTEQEIVL